MCNDILKDILVYIESGIPVIATSINMQHAFSIIGHGKINFEKIDELTIQQSKARLEASRHFVL